MATSDSDPIEERTYLERSDVGVSLTVKLKRGTETRDQDELTAKVKAATLDDACTDMDDLRAYLRDLSDDLRAIQPVNEAEE
ncbi:DUF7389 domain-containing protein [Halospeciosus flavus]|uniref:DUF7389 domain-containing protein n=1 Tax=Halospeciosus flavus TaxID=3032283 RepID=A0ABD5Z697_9EURY|nr:hypothetical protein [Halospeciosus flavus]